MYMDQLSVETIAVSSIFLDPNNPRFWTEQNTRVVPDKRVSDAKVQSDARSRIDKYGIEELYNSILRNGFLLLDRIVVRPLPGSPAKFVVVEGNRRFRSLCKLRDDIDSSTVVEEGIDEDYLGRLKATTDQIQVLVYRGAATEDISWILQGIRHISGIREWDPAQRAKLVAEQIDTMKRTFRSAGQCFGLTPQGVGKLYRTYKALEQMRSDEDYGSKARNDFFSLFEEAYRNVAMRQWLGWSEETKSFDNKERIKRFYSWILADEDHEQKRRRIHDPHQIKEVAYLVSHNQDLFEAFEAHELPIGEAYGRAKAGEAKPKDWRRAVASAMALIADLPQSAMFDEPKEFIAALDELADAIGKRRAVAEAQSHG